MRRPLLIFFGLACAFLGACAAAVPKDATAEARRESETAATLRQAFDAGRSLEPKDPAFVAQLEGFTLAYLLSRGNARYAGARRLLDLHERQPEDPLLKIYLPPPDDKGRFFAFQDDEAFRSGAYSNNYDGALFSPFFRQTLLEYLSQGDWDEAGLLRLEKRLKMALVFTPRFGPVYPNQLKPEARQAVEDYLKQEPRGVTADRLRMLLWWDQRNGGWDQEQREADERLRLLADTTRDELLKMELKDALEAPVAKPEKAFWMSFFIPGLGQIAQGDLLGGLLLGGLTASAWVWMGENLYAANQASDDASRQAAYGTAALGGGLALMGHAFTAMNAQENAHLLNVVIEWDLLSKPRLQ